MPAEHAVSAAQEAQHLAEPHLEPGETLLWAGHGRSRHALPEILPLCLMPLLLFGAFGASVTFMFWHAQQQQAQWRLAHAMPGTPPTPASPDWTLLVLFGALGLVFSALLLAVQYAVTARRAYVVTDRRLLVLMGVSRGGAATAHSYGPQEIAFVRGRTHPDGTGDVLFARADRIRASVNGLPVRLLPFCAVGFRGIEGGREVETLVERLRDGTGRTS